MKQLVKRILKESIKEKLQKRLEKDGLAETLNILGITFQELLSMLGMSMDEFTKKYNPFEGILSIEKLEKGYNSALNEFVNDIPTTIRTYRYSPTSIKRGVIDYIYLKFYWDLVDNKTEIDLIPNTYDLLEIMIYPLLEKDPRYKKIVDSIIKESVGNILIEETLTKSTNKEFNKYKDSKFHSLREYTFQDIVNNWEELSNHKNHNIKTIKFFVENPDEITELTYDEKGLEDGYHRLIASKILNKPKVKYTMLKEDTNKKLSAYQKLVDNVVSDLKYQCETQDYESEEIITFDACDFIETLTEVKVVDITRDNTIQLSIKYDYIRYHDEDEFVYELKKGMKKYGNFKIEVIDSINTRNRQW